MPTTCWILGVEEEQARDMLPDTVSMGFPLVGDLNRYGCTWTPEDADYDEDLDREQRRALLTEFRRLYPGVLEARERHPVRIVDPFGLWMFSKRTMPHDLVVVHVKRGEGREAVAIVRVIGPYFYLETSPWPHRLPVEMICNISFKLPSPYSGWGEVFSKAIADSSVEHLARVRAGEPIVGSAALAAFLSGPGAGGGASRRLTGTPASPQRGPSPCAARAAQEWG